MERGNCRRTQARKRKKRASETEIIWFEIQDDFVPSEKLKAEIVDYCEGGFGLCMNRALKPGKVLRFFNGRSASDYPEKGIVTWATQSQDEFRAGVKFI